MAAEYYSANKATLDISYFRQFATELGWPSKDPTILFLDCQTVINLIVAPEITNLVICVLNITILVSLL